MRRKSGGDTTLDDVVEILNGLAVTLMKVGAKLDEIYLLVDRHANSASRL